MNKTELQEYKEVLEVLQKDFIKGTKTTLQIVEAVDNALKTGDEFPNFLIMATRNQMALLHLTLEKMINAIVILVEELEDEVE